MSVKTKKIVFVYINQADCFEKIQLLLKQKSLNCKQAKLQSLLGEKKKKQKKKQKP